MRTPIRGLGGSSGPELVHKVMSSNPAGLDSPLISSRAVSSSLAGATALSLSPFVGTHALMSRGSDPSALSILNGSSALGAGTGGRGKDGSNSRGNSNSNASASARGGAGAGAGVVTGDNVAAEAFRLARSPSQMLIASAAAQNGPALSPGEARTAYSSAMCAMQELSFSSAAAFLDRALLSAPPLLVQVQGGPGPARPSTSSEPGDPDAFLSADEVVSCLLMRAEALYYMGRHAEALLDASRVIGVLGYREDEDEEECKADHDDASDRKNAGREGSSGGLGNGTDDGPGAASSEAPQRSTRAGRSSGSAKHLADAWRLCGMCHVAQLRISEGLDCYRESLAHRADEGVAHLAENASHALTADLEVASRHRPDVFEENHAAAIAAGSGSGSGSGLVSPALAAKSSASASSSFWRGQQQQPTPTARKGTAPTPKVHSQIYLV